MGTSSQLPWSLCSPAGVPSDRLPPLYNYRVMDPSTLANSVARAVSAAFEWSSPPESRKEAIDYLESVKFGDVRVLSSASFILVKKDFPSEIRLQGFKFLQHVVRFRWYDFNIEERKNLVTLSMELMSGMASPHEEWSLKSQCAALIAEVIRREGMPLWQELLPSIVSLCSRGPVEAELVLMTLRWLPEDITVHNEDLEGERRRYLLRGLTQRLPEVLSLLYNLLEQHFGAALREAGRKDMGAAKRHAMTVIAALHAASAYAEWAPIPDLAKYGLINGCGVLLSSIEFRLQACEFFKLVSGRKRSMFACNPECDSAMGTIFQILVNTSKDILGRYSFSDSDGIDESALEFAECVCETMVLIGSSYLQCILGDALVLQQYLQQMLDYFRHFKFALHFHSLNFWLVLMREVVAGRRVGACIFGSDMTLCSPASSGSQADKVKKLSVVVINDDICGAILNACFQRMLKTQVLSNFCQSEGTVELWAVEFDIKGDFGQYRSRLLDLLRHVTAYKPIVATAKVCQRVAMILKHQSACPSPAEDLTLIDNMQVALEIIVSVIFDADHGSLSLESQCTIQKILEDFLQQLLSLHWFDPKLLEVLGRYLGAYGPYLKHYPGSVSAVIKKLFGLLAEVSPEVKDKPGASAHRTRLEICFCFIRLAKAADKRLLPHMEDIMNATAHLQREGHLLAGENNVLGEAFLIIASSAGMEQQREAITWLLGPLREQWSRLEWQSTYLSDPWGIVKMFSDSSMLWSIYHCVTFFEKVLKRSGFKKSNVVEPRSDDGDALLSHPIAPHLSWLLPPLLNLLHCVHSLWRPTVFEVLPMEIKTAMRMNQAEQCNLLGDACFKSQKKQTPSEGHDIGGNVEECIAQTDSSIRNWLKGIRESGYSIFGLSATIGSPFFSCLEGSSACSMLMESIDCMEFRHIRQLIHLAINPLIKFCPPDMWDVWFSSLFHPLLIHCAEVLNSSWHCLLHDGRARAPDKFFNISESDLKVEVIEEKLLRDLTREVCLLLSVVASTELNGGLFCLEQSGCVIQRGKLLYDDLPTFSRSSLIGFVLCHGELAHPALQVSVNAFSWTDGEATSKLIPFCSAVIIMAFLTDNVELRGFVVKDLFCSVIQGLMLESNAFISSDLVRLCRDIFVYFSDKDPSPRQILLSLPNISPANLRDFEDALGKTNSGKEQKQHMKNLLLLGAGETLKALADQRTTNVITNVARIASSSSRRRHFGMKMCRC